MGRIVTPVSILEGALSNIMHSENHQMFINHTKSSCEHIVCICFRKYTEIFQLTHEVQSAKDSWKHIDPKNPIYLYTPKAFYQQSSAKPTFRYIEWIINNIPKKSGM